MPKSDIDWGRTTKARQRAAHRAGVSWRKIHAHGEGKKWFAKAREVAASAYNIDGVLEFNRFMSLPTHNMAKYFEVAASRLKFKSKYPVDFTPRTKSNGHAWNCECYFCTCWDYERGCGDSG